MPVIQFIPQMYCPTCHLSTRMDITRCLHCNQPLRPAPVKALKKRIAKRAVPVKGHHIVATNVKARHR